MRYLLFIPIAITALLVACGGGNSASDDLSKELGDVCAKNDNADTEHIKVDTPDAGASVTSPLKVEGKIDAIQQEFWVSVVKANDEHVIDYPARSKDLEEGKMSPFSVSVPFSSGEDAAACLWVYRHNVENPDDAVRIPIKLLSTESTPATGQ